jgi:hypothetical protein
VTDCRYTWIHELSCEHHWLLLPVSNLSSSLSIPCTSSSFFYIASKTPIIHLPLDLICGSKLLSTCFGHCCLLFCGYACPILISSKIEFCLFFCDYVNKANLVTVGTNLSDIFSVFKTENTLFGNTLMCM